MLYRYISYDEQFRRPDGRWSVRTLKVEGLLLVEEENGYIEEMVRLGYFSEKIIPLIDYRKDWPLIHFYVIEDGKPLGRLEAGGYGDD